MGRSPGDGKPQPNSRPKTLRPFLFLLGWLFFGIGAVGVVVPGLPTTTFMLLALWAFARSSKRFHDWLYSHPRFGPPLQNWNRHRVISVRGKSFALLTMAASLVYLILWSGVPTWIITLVASVMAYGAWFILTKPSRPSPGARVGETGGTCPEEG